ncbi:MAG: flavodoxin family protein [Coriobacteriales bacterium]|jgi:multimeric flavodoxin WrbA
MSKIFVLTGSSRKGGNTNAMAEAFIEAAKEAGHEVKSIDVTRLNLNGCHGCMTCFKTGKACSFDDDFNLIADDMLEADGWVFSFPVYWYSIPGQTKCVLDNTFSFFVGGKDCKGKKIGIISACGEDSMDLLHEVVEPFHKACALTGWDLVGEVLVPGINDPGAVKDTDGIEQAKALVEKF